MADSHNTYLAYKRDTNLLLYWVIQTSNQIIQSRTYEHDASLQVNTSGQTTVTGLLSMAKLIAGNTGSHEVPSAVYRLFQAVIKARTKTWQAFQRVGSNEPDPETGKSNETHKFFIESLRQAFEVLGGRQWELSQNTHQLGAEVDARNDIKDATFCNSFSKLDVVEDHDESVDEDSAPSNGPVPAQKCQKNRNSKTAKGKKKARKQQKPVRKGSSSLRGVPLESYRIIGDESVTAMEYRMAVLALMQEWCVLREYMMGVWADVAYAGLNSATAGAVSKMAIAMLERSEFAVFLDFPGHDSYETVMKALMGRENIVPRFSLWHHTLTGEGTKVAEYELDMDEIKLVYAYNDFMDFITDFQKNSNGKPSMSMTKELGNWDPEFDLQTATKEERLRWRRVYTINWLYDLVNLCSAIFVLQNTKFGKNLDHSKIDWKAAASWSRRLYGIDEFAGFVCSLAWQKQGTSIRGRIMPHHMLQLQAIVDSLTVSRGWSIRTLEGHVLRDPAWKFRPRRDVDLFLDLEEKRVGRGWLLGADVLRTMLQKSTETDDLFGCRAFIDLLEKQFKEFIVWLGQSPLLGQDAEIPSRFSGTSSNGLWDYSPYLCGVNLMEGLEITCYIGMALWNRRPEPVLAIHLHNMLLQKDYITKPVSLYDNLQRAFQGALFEDGVVPKSDFAAALMAQIRRSNPPAAGRGMHPRRATVPRSADIHVALDLSRNWVFTIKPSLVLYRESGWNIERVPERDMRPGSELAGLRLSQTKQFVDPETGMRRLDHTELVRHHLAAMEDDKHVWSEDSLVELADFWKDFSRNIRERSELLESMSDALRRSGTGRDSVWCANDVHGRNQVPGVGTPLGLWGREVLARVKADTHSDVAGRTSVLGVNYVWVTARFMALFDEIEKQLWGLRNPPYVEAFEAGRAPRLPPRIGLVYNAMLQEDE